MLMARMSCRECGEMVSTNARVCHYCGRKPKLGFFATIKLFFKWAIYLLLALIAMWFIYFNTVYNDEEKKNLNNLGEQKNSQTDRQVDSNKNKVIKNNSQKNMEKKHRLHERNRFSDEDSIHF